MYVTYICFASEPAIMLHALHIQYIGWDVMACIHNVLGLANNRRETQENDYLSKS